MTNKDLQTTTQKTKDLVTLTPLKTEGELRCSERVTSSCSIRSDDLKLITSNPWYSSFLVSNNPLLRISWKEPQALDYPINCDTFCTFAKSLLSLPSII